MARGRRGFLTEAERFALTCETEIPGAGRYLLQRRGIFTTRAQRGRNYSLSAVQIAEIEHNLKGLEPHLMRVPSRGA